MAKNTTIAVPVYGDRIALHFAWCTHVLIIKTDGKRILRQRRRAVSVAEPWDFARSLLAMNINQLVCGAIPYHIREWFRTKNVQVISDQRGPAQDAIKRLQHQSLLAEEPDPQSGRGAQAPSTGRKPVE